MKKIIFILMFAILLVGTVSAWEFDNRKSFDKTIGDYGKIEIINNFGLGSKIAEYTLINNTDVCIINCEASGTAKLYEEGKIFNEFTFKNKEKDNRNLNYNLFIYEEVKYTYENKSYTINEWVKYNNKNLKEGEYTWKLTARKDAYESIDWIASTFGEDLTEWAWWDTLSGDFEAFTSSGTFTVPIGVTNLSVLIVAGGGGGGGSNWNGGGGGGAGGLILNNSYSSTPTDDIAVIVGLGGAGGGPGENHAGVIGFNSSFGTIISTGGGGGASETANGTDGGSGGGASEPNYGSGVGRSGIPGQGHNGGNGSTAEASGGAGGGGAGELGGNSAYHNAGNGGDGLQIWELEYLAGGGGGGEYTTGYGSGLGGAGGGGTGGEETDGTAGTVNTGAGGGGAGGYSENCYGGAGGSGLVIVRWITQIQINQTIPFNFSNFISTTITFGANVTATETIANVSLYINDSIVETNSSGILGNYTFTQILSDGYYEWKVGGVVDTSYEANSSSRYFTIARAFFNDIQYNVMTYETSEEIYYANITTDGNAPTNVKLIYNGTTYPNARASNMNANNYNLTQTIQIPIDTGNKSLHFNYTVSGTEYSTSNYNQTVNPTQFGLCNATLTQKYMNITFKDENKDTNINATLDYSLWNYWLGNGSIFKSLLFTNTTANYDYAFCLNADNRTLHNNKTIQYASSGYPQRKYFDSTDLTNTTTNKTLYLLASTDGIYSMIRVVDQTGDTLSGVEITLERQFDGIWTIIGQDSTDAAGAVTFWVNYNYDHRLTFVKDGCTGTTSTIRPTQATYTQQLTCGGSDEAEYVSQAEGVTYTFSPSSLTWLPENTLQTFGVVITANLSNLIYYSINITDEDMNLLNSTYGTTSTGGALSVIVNTSAYDKLYGRYYVNVGNGTFLLDPSIWVIRDITSWGGSVYSSLKTLVSTTTDIEDNYTMLMLIFFLLFVGMATFTYSTGMELSQPGICLIILFFFVAMCSLVGLFTIDFSPNEFTNKYGVLLVVFFLTAGYSLGQWTKT